MGSKKYKKFSFSLCFLEAQEPLFWFSGLAASELVLLSKTLIWSHIIGESPGRDSIFAAMTHSKAQGLICSAMYCKKYSLRVRGVVDGQGGEVNVGYPLLFAGICQGPNLLNPVLAIACGLRVACGLRAYLMRNHRVRRKSAAQMFFVCVSRFATDLAKHCYSILGSRH